MIYRFTVNMPVRWKDIDSFGVVNNAVYFTMLEQTRYHYFDHLDLLRDGNFPFVVGETSCRYLRPAGLGMKLEVSACIDRLGDKSFHMQFEIHTDQELLASAESTLVWVDEHMHSATIPEPERLRISEFEQIPQRS